MISDTATRVGRQTNPQINARIERDWKARLSALRQDDRVALIDRRLAEIDMEWDIERSLQTNFAALSLVGIALASKVDRRWTALVLGVPAFMIQHALQGWCPPLPVMRRLGLRTAREINDERFALKSLRGDFANLEQSRDAAAAHEAVKDQGRPNHRH